MAKQSSERPVNIDQAIQSKAGGYYIPADQLNKMVGGVMQILRNNFASMMDDLKSGQTRTKPEKWYDKIRNFLWGYDNPKNPWYLANRLGGLGGMSRRNEVSLYEYKLFNSWMEKYNSLNITEARLVLDDMIRPHLEKIEDEIRDYIRNFVQPYYVYRPEFGPPKEPSPASTGGKKGKGKGLDTAEPAPVTEPVSKTSTTSRVPAPGSGSVLSGDAPVAATTNPEEASGKVTARKPGKKPHPKTMAEKLKQDLAKKAAEQAAREAAEEAARNKSSGIGHGAYDESVIESTPKHHFKEFDGCTLYERTLICLDKMRSIKED
jgi:hypothetical protein